MEAEKDSDSGPASRTRLRDAASKKGMCSSEVNLTGMVRWGKRKRVRFLGRHEEQKVETLSMNVKDKEVEEEGKGKEKQEGHDVDEEDEVEEVDGEAVELESSKAKKNLKRKCHGSRRAQMPKRAKREKKQSQIQVHNQSKKKKIKNSIERWSVDRWGHKELFQ